RQAAVAVPAGGRRRRHEPGRAPDAAHARHHPFHDAVRAQPARDHQGLAQAPHRGRRRCAGAGGQPAAQAVRADADHDEAHAEGWACEDDARHEGHAAGHAMSDDTERIARESLAAAFRGRLLVDDDAVAPMLVDWRGRYRGRALAVAMPEDTEAVAAVVRWCRDNGYAVV